MFFNSKKVPPAPFFWLSHGWAGAMFDQNYKKHLLAAGVGLKDCSQILCVSEFWRPSKLSVSTSPKHILLHDFETSDTRFDSVHWPYACSVELPTLVRQQALGSGIAIGEDERRGVDRSVWGAILPVLGKGFLGNICTLGLAPEMSANSLQKLAAVFLELRRQNVAVVICANAVKTARAPLARLEDPLGHLANGQLDVMQGYLEKGAAPEQTFRNVAHMGALLVHFMHSGAKNPVHTLQAWGSECYWFYKQTD